MINTEILVALDILVRFGVGPSGQWADKNVGAPGLVFSRILGFAGEYQQRLVVSL